MQTLSNRKLWNNNSLWRYIYKLNSMFWLNLASFYYMFWSIMNLFCVSIPFGKSYKIVNLKKSQNYVLFWTMWLDKISNNHHLWHSFAGVHYTSRLRLYFKTLILPPSRKKADFIFRLCQSWKLCPNIKFTKASSFSGKQNCDVRCYFWHFSKLKYELIGEKGQMKSDFYGRRIFFL